MRSKGLFLLLLVASSMVIHKVEDALLDCARG